MRGTGTETSPCLRDGFAVLGLAYQLIVCDVPQSSLQKTNDYTGSQEASREKRCTSARHHSWQWNQRHRDRFNESVRQNVRETHLQWFNKCYHSLFFLLNSTCFAWDSGIWLMINVVLCSGGEEKPCSPLSLSYIRLHSPSQIVATLTCQLQGPKYM